MFESSVNIDLFYNNTKRCFIYYFWLFNYFLRQPIFINLIMEEILILKCNSYIFFNSIIVQLYIKKYLYRIMKKREKDCLKILNNHKIQA